MSEEDIIFYNNKLAAGNSVVMTAEEAKDFIKAYMKELLDRDNYDIEDLKDDFGELADYIKDITDSEAEFIAIRECPMTATNITIEPLMRTSVRDYLLDQVAAWSLNACDIASDEDIPQIFNTKDQTIFTNIINRMMKA